MKQKDVLKKEDLKKLLVGIGNSDILEKESAIAWDGKNLVLRIPREITESLKLTKENRFEKSIKFKIENKDGKELKTFEIVQRNKPPRIKKDEKE